ncbi:FBD-associated F-box protein At5g22730-like [Durio zibethinus]|uniref:FBD-associated F-box protein At5g22730-like n=1 Tax=Durio zibethinus TaxID=66656 RepID=A0A6P6AII8_DURZI|nr:FBD-associated F-box protein At5g22730-like [Durio zibethinus]XP_022764612.1 FBD-associated F-box protein At5g22730-like [Durio zibethinus]
MLNASVNGPYFNNDYTNGALMYMLQKSPNLEFLILTRGFNLEDQGMIMDTIPGCFQSSLKSVRIFNAGGDEEKLSFLKYFYENAPVLEWLYVSCSPELSEDSEKQEEIINDLQQLRGGSGCCTIVFDPYVP